MRFVLGFLPWQVDPLNPRVQLQAKPPPISVQNPPCPQGLGLQGSFSEMRLKKKSCDLNPADTDLHFKILYRQQHQTSHEFTVLSF